MTDAVIKNYEYNKYFKSIDYNTTVNVLYLTPELYNAKSFYDIILKNKKKLKVHEFMKNKQKSDILRSREAEHIKWSISKKQIISLIIEINNNYEQIFICFNQCDYSIYEDLYSEYYALAKHTYHTIIYNILYNKICMNQFIFGLVYKTEYKKKTNGKKNLVISSTYINKNINLNHYFILNSIINKNIYDYSSILKIIKNKSKKSKNDKIIKYILTKKSYFRILNIELIELILSKIIYM